MPPAHPELKLCSGAEQGARCGKRRPGESTQVPGSKHLRLLPVKLSHAKAGGESHPDLGVQDLLTAHLGVRHPPHAFQGPDPDNHLVITGELQQLLRSTKMGEMLPRAGQKVARD